MSRGVRQRPQGRGEPAPAVVSLTVAHRRLLALLAEVAVQDYLGETEQRDTKEEEPEPHDD